jgi:O-antigen/teichoic acid export membrane protein
MPSPTPSDDPVGPLTSGRPSGLLAQGDEEELARVGRDTGLMLGGTGVGRSFGLLFNFLAARVAGPGAYGLFTLAQTVVNYLVTLATFGLDLALVRFVAIHQGSGARSRIRGVLTRALAINLGLGVLLGSSLLLLAAPVAEGVFGKPELATPFRWMAVSVPFLVVINLFCGATQGLRKMAYTPLVRDLTFPVARCLLLALFLFLGLRLHALLLAHGLVSVLWGAAALLLLFRVFAPLTAGVRPEPEPGLLPFAFPLFLNDLVVKSLRWSDILFLGVFQGAGDVGVYRISQITSEISRLIYQAFKTTFAPVISLLHHRGEGESLRRQFAITSKWSFAASFPPLVFFSLMAEESLGLFGPAFAKGALCLVILNAGRMVAVSTGLSANLIVMAGRSRWTLANSLGGNALTFLLNALLIPRHGMLGAAWAFALATAILNVVQMVEARIFFGFFPYHAGYLKPLLASLAAGGVARLTHPLLPLPAAGAYALAALLFLLLYGGLLVLLGLPPEDRLLAKHLLSRLRPGGNP